MTTMASVHPLTILANARPQLLHPEEFKLLAKHVATYGIFTGHDERGRYIEWPEGAKTYRSDPITGTLPERNIHALKALKVKHPIEIRGGDGRRGRNGAYVIQEVNS